MGVGQTYLPEQMKHGLADSCGFQAKKHQTLKIVSHWLCALCFRVSSCPLPAWRGTFLTCFSCGETYSTGMSPNKFISPATRADTHTSSLSFNRQKSSAWCWSVTCSWPSRQQSTMLIPVSWMQRNCGLNLSNVFLLAPTLMMRSAWECWWWCQRRSWLTGSPTLVTCTPWPVQADTWLQQETCRRLSVGWNRYWVIMILSQTEIILTLCVSATRKCSK